MINLFFVLAVTGVTSCVSCRDDNTEGRLKNKSVSSRDTPVNTFFEPDTSINRQLFLSNPSSIEKAFGNIMPLIDKEADLPHAYWLDASKKQYLKMIFFPGSSSNSISQFEVGYSSSLAPTVKTNPSEFTPFMTENSILLGMTKAEVINIKGNNYTEKTTGKSISMRYVLDDFNNSTFLKEYKMPVYIAEYWIEENKLIKYRFGFEYP